ncbi:MAG: lipopolysaccharide transport periplasmic protein LptA [Macromonas sp.]
MLLPALNLWCGVALATLMLTPLAHAERADRQQPMNIEADNLRYDDTRQTSVFTGRVVVSKGSIAIRGQQLEVRQDAQGHQFGLVQGSTQQPAFFRQKRDGVNEFIEGEAQRIEYNSQADTVKFSGQAVLRRYLGATLSDETRGSTIVYNNTTDVFTVDGGPTNRSNSNPSGRVRTMLSPSRNASAPTNTATPADATPTTLQPSTTLEPRR